MELKDLINSRTLQNILKGEKTLFLTIVKVSTYFGLDYKDYI